MMAPHSFWQATPPTMSGLCSPAEWTASAPTTTFAAQRWKQSNALRRIVRRYICRRTIPNQPSVSQIAAWLEILKRTAPGLDELPREMANRSRRVAASRSWEQLAACTLSRGCPAFLLNIEKRSLPRLMLSGDGLASKDAV